jgi:hypothetical protein
LLDPQDVELTEAEEALVLATLDPIGATANAEATDLASRLSGLADGRRTPLDSRRHHGRMVCEKPRARSR